MSQYWPVVVVLAVIGLFFLSRAAGKKDSAEAHRLVEQGAALIDVRTPGEYAAGHLDGARNIPVAELKGRLTEVGPKDQPVVVYCASGARSAAAASALQQAGFATVLDLGGIGNW
jgi:phage shock protein E